MTTRRRFGRRVPRNCESFIRLIGTTRTNAEFITMMTAIRRIIDRREKGKIELFIDNSQGQDISFNFTVNDNEIPPVAGEATQFTFF